MSIRADIAEKVQDAVVDLLDGADYEGGMMEVTRTGVSTVVRVPPMSEGQQAKYILINVVES